MNLTPKLKQFIDGLTYQQLLSRWRFAPIGDPWFQDETGEYFAQRMADLRNADETGGQVHVAASKNLGWEKS